MEYPDPYLLYIEYFNGGKYQSAQMILDDHWVHLPADHPEKNFFGGLVQVAVALYHLEHQDPERGQQSYARARSLLLPYGTQSHGLELTKLIEEMDFLFERKVNPAQPKTDLRGLFPRMHFQTQ